MKRYANGFGPMTKVAAMPDIIYHEYPLNNLRNQKTNALYSM